MSEVSAEDFTSADGAAAASAAEWEVRVDLAAMFRLTQLFGWDDTVWNHITARAPGTDHTFFMHRFGLLYEEVTASNLIKVDEEGRVLEGPPDVNTAGFVIHSAIHLNHPRNKFVFHAHPPSALAATAFKDGIPYWVQDSSMLYGKIGYHDWEGLSVDLDERFRIAENLGDGKVLVMRNHGFLSVGETAGEAFMNMYYMIRMCEVAVQAQASGLELEPATPGLWEMSAKQYEAFSPGNTNGPRLSDDVIGLTLPTKTRMKITNCNIHLVDVPLAKPIATAIHQMRSVACVLLELETDQGLVGQSYVFTLNAVRLKALEEMLLGFLHRVQGKDPHDIGSISQQMWNDMNPIGHKGFTIAALTAIDTACWDLIGKAAEQPLHKLFGACRDRVKTYASGGLWLSQSIDECVAEAADLIDGGFRSMKIRVGSPTIAQDVERVRAVRDAIGPDIELLADANQGMTVKHAIRLGHELEMFSLGWFEEPVPYQNLRGCAEVRAALVTPIAAGETEYTRYGMRDILEKNTVDVLMPDLQRIGGLSEMRRACALALSHDIPVSTHIFTEHSLCIGGAEPGCVSVEHMPWFAPLFNESMEIKDGMIDIPNRPDIGFSFNREAVQRFKM